EKARTSGTLHKERSMATQSFLDMIKEFGTGLGVPKFDVDKLIEVQRRNIDALGRSAQVATEGAKSLADKQREIIETPFRGDGARFKADREPTGNAREANRVCEEGLRHHSPEYPRHRGTGDENNQ